jgi:hypothetical protein
VIRRYFGHHYEANGILRVPRAELREVQGDSTSLDDGIWIRVFLLVGDFEAERLIEVNGLTDRIAREEGNC